MSLRIVRCTYFVHIELNKEITKLFSTSWTETSGFQSICNSPPPPTLSRTRIVLHAPLTGTPTYARREWLGQPCRTPDHGLHPSSEAMGSVGPGAAPTFLHLPRNATTRSAVRTTHSPLTIMVSGVEWLKGFLVKLPVETNTP